MMALLNSGYDELSCRAINHLLGQPPPEVMLFGVGTSRCRWHMRSRQPVCPPIKRQKP